MIIKRPPFRILLLAIYLLGLNVLSLYHSFEHQHIASNFSDVSSHKNFTVFQVGQPDVLCELCDFFQNQVLFLIGEQGIGFTFLPLLSLSEKPFDLLLVKVFTLLLRGPPSVT